MIARLGSVLVKTSEIILGFKYLGTRQCISVTILKNGVNVITIVLVGRSGVWVAGGGGAFSGINTLKVPKYI